MEQAFLLRCSFLLLAVSFFSCFLYLNPKYCNMSTLIFAAAILLGAPVTAVITVTNSNIDAVLNLIR
jgi:hypothetical protein